MPDPIYGLADVLRRLAEARSAPEFPGLFHAVRGDVHLRAFPSLRILESPYVPADRSSLPLFREFTGAAEPNAKYPEPQTRAVAEALARAEGL